MSAAQLKTAEETIRRRLRGMQYTLYKRVSANIGVYTKGNEQRMGKGKGKFDYWAARIAVSRIVFELKGDLHEKIAREAFRLAGHKLPGTLTLHRDCPRRRDHSLCDSHIGIILTFGQVSGNLSRREIRPWSG